MRKAPPHDFRPPLEPAIQEAYLAAQKKKGQLDEIRELSTLMIRDVARAREFSEEQREKWKSASGEMALNMLAIHLEGLFRAAAALAYEWHIKEANRILATADALIQMSKDKATIDFFSTQLTEYQRVMTGMARDMKQLQPSEVEGLRRLARTQMSKIEQKNLDRQLNTGAPQDVVE